MLYSKKVLVIEDDIELANLLEIHLFDLNCKVTKSNDGYAGLYYALEDDFDLIILDINLPSMDGFEICKKIRNKKPNTSIIIVSARDDEMDKVLGLELGADDYVTKPFSIRELLARIKASFRRMENLNGSDENILGSLQLGELIIESDKKRVTVKNERIDLTPKEFDLLYLLASNPGRTFNREELLNKIWGYDFSCYEHTVNTHINRLRNKIENDIQKPNYILTTWGMGYRFNEDILLTSQEYDV